MVAEVLSLQIHHAPHVAWQTIDVIFASQLVLMLTALLPTIYLPLHVMSQGEAPIVQVAWAALCVSFSASLAFVVWGRSGL